MRAGIAALAIALAGCGSGRSPTPGLGSAGDRLEVAATAAGLVADPAAQDIVGAWARDTDRACIVPAADGGDARIGLLLQYGPATGCAASGTIARRGRDLDIRLGECRIAARLDAGRIVLPADVPPVCDRACTGHASLAAMSVEQQSGSVSEARTLRAPSGRALCGD